MRAGAIASRMMPKGITTSAAFCSLRSVLISMDGSPENPGRSQQQHQDEDEIEGSEGKAGVDEVDEAGDQAKDKPPDQAAADTPQTAKDHDNDRNDGQFDAATRLDLEHDAVEHAGQSGQRGAEPEP